MHEGAGRFIGQKVRRNEDRRLLRGAGTYVDDVVVPDMLHAAFVRSTQPHATITGVDATAALRLPGVHAVFTGQDMAGLTNAMFGLMSVPGCYDPLFHCLAIDRARHVGDPIALVVAESRRVAEDGCELVEVSYEPLPAIANAAQAFDPDRPPIWPGAGSNVLRRASKVHGDIDAAFASADRVISERFAQTRHANQPMETRGSVAEWLPETQSIRFHSSCQAAHVLRWGLGLYGMPISGRAALRQLIAERDRLARFAKGARDLMGQMRPPKPAKGEPPPPAMDMKPMVAQFRSQPGRFKALVKNMGGLLAHGPERVPQVVAKDVGGAFGCKSDIHREDVALVAAARHLGKSVKWIEDRNEHLMVGGHARDEAAVIELAMRNDGTILGMRFHLTMDVGAYPAHPVEAPMFGEIARVMVPGPYRVPALQFDQVVVSTNKGSIVPYRGPWAVETWVRERMFDVVAREMGLGRDEIRLRNMIGADELPTPMITGPMLDVRMSAKRTLEDALAIADIPAWRATQEAARAAGRVLGMGFATFIEAAPGPPDFFDHVMPGGGGFGREPMRAVLRTDGTIALHTQQVPHGQGHETTLAQIAAERLGVPYESVKLVYGNTAETPFGLNGTSASRSAPMAGGAVNVTATQLRSLVEEIAADLLEAHPDDIEITAGNVHVAGVPARGLTMADVAAEAVKRQPGQSKGEAIRVVGEWDGGAGGWTQATHVCWVEVDLETGFVTIPRYVAVEDCGELINPGVVDGQICGGIAQGVGSVLYERITYDEDANFKSGTFMDYLIPTAMEIPAIEIHHVQTPSDIESNYRGVGEGGMIVAPAAITNAIEDALAHLGVRITEQHLPPNRILELAGVV